MSRGRVTSSLSSRCRNQRLSASLLILYIKTPGYINVGEKEMPHLEAFLIFVISNQQQMPILFITIAAGVKSCHGNIYINRSLCKTRINN
ncbi:hypothetical protein CEXT_32901 [Caerostris extrusa]|uniref:Uncharacterized protein n=1 Tax=Caerostris extrusa TaxID=172846 RepID=A0AAV4SNI0_CAEEX|nr:hypothetical protein CEXT_32901 [Caerostris extrusa]